MNRGGLTGVEIHRHYGVVAPEKGSVPSPRYLLRRARFFEHVRQWPKGGRVLELGCGAGALTYELNRAGFDCTAVEHSPTAAAVAADINRGPNAADIRTEAKDWDAAFDCLVALEVLEHIEDDHAAVASWHRWLRPGGLMLLLVPALAGEEVNLSRPILASTLKQFDKTALYQPPFNLIVNNRNTTAEVYDRSKGPDERDNLADTIASEMLKDLNALRSVHRPH